MPRRNEVSIWIKAKDLASSKLKRFDRNLNAIWRSAKNVARGIATVGAAAGAAVFGLGKLVQRGGRYITVANAFATATGGQTGALDRLQEAAGGMISKFDLMQKFNQAIALGSAKNTEQFGQMIRIAQQLSRSLGVDLNYALESLNTGIARQSRRWLDNLGIIISVSEANKAYAASVGKTASELTDLEKREAFRQAALREGERIVAQMGETTGRAGDAWNRFTTALADARDRFAEITANMPEVEAFFDALTDAVTTLGEELPSVASQLASIATTLVDMKTGKAGQVYRIYNAQMASMAGDPERLRAFQEAVDAERAQVGQDIEEAKARLRADAMARAQVAMAPDATRVAGTPSGTEGVAGDLVTEEKRQELEAEIDEMAQELAGLARVSSRASELINSALGIGGAGGAGGGGGGGGGGAGGTTTTTTPASLSTLYRTAFGGGISQFTPVPETGFADLLPRSAGEDAEEGADKVNDASLAFVNAMDRVAGASLDSAEAITQSLLPALTDVIRAASSPLTGALVGLGVTLIGGIFGGRDRPRVVVDEYGSRAREQMREDGERPMNVTVNLLDSEGRPIEQTQYELNRRSRRDAVSRLPGGRTS